MESRFCTYKRVGYLRERVAYELGIEFTGVIYASPGVLKHIIKRHGRQFDKRTRTGILEWMKKILDDPDYIGRNMSDEIVVVDSFTEKKVIGSNMEYDGSEVYDIVYPVIIEGEGLRARALQHEIDHLDGVLYGDRANEPYHDVEEEECE